MGKEKEGGIVKNSSLVIGSLLVIVADFLSTGCSHPANTPVSHPSTAPSDDDAPAMGTPKEAHNSYAKTVYDENVADYRLISSEDLQACLDHLWYDPKHEVVHIREPKESDK